MIQRHVKPIEYLVQPVANQVLNSRLLKPLFLDNNSPVREILLRKLPRQQFTLHDLTPAFPLRDVKGGVQIKRVVERDRLLLHVRRHASVKELDRHIALALVVSAEGVVDEEERVDAVGEEFVARRVAPDEVPAEHVLQFALAHAADVVVD